MFKQCIYGVFMNFYFLFPDSGCLNKTEILYVSMSCTTHISNSHALILCKNMKPDLHFLAYYSLIYILHRFVLRLK